MLTNICVVDGGHAGSISASAPMRMPESLPHAPPSTHNCQSGEASWLGSPGSGFEYLRSMTSLTTKPEMRLSSNGKLPGKKLDKVLARAMPVTARNSDPKCSCIPPANRQADRHSQTDNKRPKSNNHTGRHEASAAFKFAPSRALKARSWTRIDISGDENWASIDLESRAELGTLKALGACAGANHRVTLAIDVGPPRPCVHQRSPVGSHDLPLRLCATCTPHVPTNANIAKHTMRATPTLPRPSDTRIRPERRRKHVGDDKRAHGEPDRHGAVGETIPHAMVHGC